MNGKIRVSIVATSLKGSSISPEVKPILNIVNGSNTRGNLLNENLFAKSNIEQNVVNSIDGATALKLDESYEIKNTEEQNALIDSFESNEEKKLAEEPETYNSVTEDVPAGVSIESASYIEKNVDNEINNINSYENKSSVSNLEEEYTPKLFTEEQSLDEDSSDGSKEDVIEEKLFDQENEDEDFEIPAFLRRQKF